MEVATVRSDLQRASGEVLVSVKRRDDKSVLDKLRQAGCLKARFPRDDDGGGLNVVTLNTSGGIAGGDDLRSSFTIGAAAFATIAGQAAERIYRALHDSSASIVQTRIEVATGGAAEWLPQEMILFDGCRVRRSLQVELAEDARFLGIESLVFGRAAMGEVVNQGSLRDVIELRRGGRLLLHDAVRLDGTIAAKLQRKAIADGAGALATMLYVAPDAEAMLEPLGRRDIAASAWDGMLIARILGATGAVLRTTVVNALRVLRGGRPLPRVWLC
jgi:urease accessory protein